MWRNFAISTPPAREGQLDRLFLHKEHFIYKLSVKRQKNSTKNRQKPHKNLSFSRLSQNSWNFQIEGSLKIEISKMRDPSKWKFPKRGKVYTSAVFCKKYQASINVFFSVLNWDSQFQNFIEEFQCLQCMSNIGLLITFHTATSGAICWPSSQAIPRFGNFYFEGSLVLEISILRDPSF